MRAFIKTHISEQTCARFPGLLIRLAKFLPTCLCRRTALIAADGGTARSLLFLPEERAAGNGCASAALIIALISGSMESALRIPHRWPVRIAPMNWM